MVKSRFTLITACLTALAILASLTIFFYLKALELSRPGTSYVETLARCTVSALYITASTVCLLATVIVLYMVLLTFRYLLTPNNTLY